MLRDLLVRFTAVRFEAEPVNNDVAVAIWKRRDHCVYLVRRLAIFNLFALLTSLIRDQLAESAVFSDRLIE
jgi:hypothetical protein